MAWWNWLKANEKKEEEMEEEEEYEIEVSESDEVDYLASVWFGLSAEGDVDIQFEWSEGTPSVANYYAQLLYSLHKGDLLQDSVRMLIASANENPEEREFIQTLLNDWAALIEKNGEEPVIDPTEVLRFQE